MSLAGLLAAVTQGMTALACASAHVGTMTITPMQTKLQEMGSSCGDEEVDDTPA